MTYSRRIASIVPMLTLVALLSPSWMRAQDSADLQPATTSAPDEPKKAGASKDDKPLWSERIVVTASRANQPLAEVPLHAKVMESDDLDAGPEYGMIDIVRRIPGLSLQGTQSDLVAHPINGGAAFRGLGGTAQSRILLMVDSVPVNDPFASYLIWSRIPTEAIDRVEVVPGSVGAWGNLALTGIVNVITRGTGDRNWGAELRLGNYDTVKGRAHYADAGHRWSGWLSGDALDTDGYQVLEPPRRGSLDEPSGKTYHTLYGRLERTLSAQSSLRLGATVFEESRRGGTPLDRGRTTENSFTIAWDRFLAGGSSFTTHAYGRSVGLTEDGPAVNSTHTAETPNESVDVPSDAWGANGRSRHDLHVGVDAQYIAVDATRLYEWDGVDYTRSLVSDGKERFAGAYVQDVIRLSGRTTITAGGRFDWISSEGGSKVERDTATGEVLSTASIPSHSWTNFNPALGFTHAASSTLRLRGAMYTGFRAGTPNELFIDTVSGSRNISNPNLSPEKLFGGELGFDWTPSRRSSTRVTAFGSRSRDLIDRVNLGRTGPLGGVIEPCGQLPPFTRCRQRRNVGTVRVYGVDLEQEVRLADNWRLHLLATLLRSKILDAEGLPEQVGNSMTRTPDETATLELRYDRSPISGALRVRYLGENFTDTTNTEQVDAQTHLDLSGALSLGRGWELTAGVQNLLDDRWIIQPGPFPTYSTPRLIHLGVRFRAR